MVERAKSAGLLTEEQIERWLNEELDRHKRLERFFGRLDQLLQIEPPMTPGVIESEIAAYGQEKNVGW